MDGVKASQVNSAISKKLIESEKLLCELDSKVGDGDHGVTVARGFKAVEAMLSEESYATPGECFAAVGKKLAVTMGGAVGPLLGAFFSAGATKLTDTEDFGLDEFVQLFESGQKRIQILGDAKPGDRTMLDALLPATEALKAARDSGDSLADALKKASDAARAGAESTKDMVAKKGRAKFLGEKSKGYVDAGATTVSLIIETLANEIE